MPAHLIDRQIRGCTPDPGAWTDFDSTRLKLWPVTLRGPPAPAPSAAVDPAADGSPTATLPPGPRARGPAPPRAPGAAARDAARRSGNPRRAAFQVLAAVENREA